MRVLVPGQVLRDAELLATYVAAEGLLSAVDGRVGPEVRRLPEAFAAVFAAEGFFYRVNAMVIYQAPLVSEGFSTEHAAERFLSAVTLPVGREAAHGRKRSPTLNTKKRISPKANSFLVTFTDLCVCPHVLRRHVQVICNEENKHKQTNSIVKEVIQCSSHKS